MRDLCVGWVAEIRQDYNAGRGPMWSAKVSFGTEPIEVPLHKDEAELLFALFRGNAPVRVRMVMDAVPVPERCTATATFKPRGFEHLGKLRCTLAKGHPPPTCEFDTDNPGSP